MALLLLARSSRRLRLLKLASLPNLLTHSTLSLDVLAVVLRNIVLNRGLPNVGFGRL
jgi:hypothetical protein